jgi:hypothetical protein
MKYFEGGRMTCRITVVISLVFLAAGILAAAQPVKDNAGRTGKVDGALFSGFSLKLGLQTSPKVSGIGNSWIAAFSLEKGLGRYLALGAELQPYLRSYSNDALPDASLSLVAAHAFLNIKIGAGLGQFIKALKFWKPYFGLGFGGAFEMQTAKYQANSDSKFKFYPAWHWLLGSEFLLKTISLIVEYQAVMVSVPNLDPDFFTNFLMLGVRF